MGGGFTLADMQSWDKMGRKKSALEQMQELVDNMATRQKERELHALAMKKGGFTRKEQGGILDSLKDMLGMGSGRFEQTDGGLLGGLDAFSPSGTIGQGTSIADQYQAYGGLQGGDKWAGDITSAATGGGGGDWMSTIMQILPMLIGGK